MYHSWNKQNCIKIQISVKLSVFLFCLAQLGPPLEELWASTCEIRSAINMREGAEGDPLRGGNLHTDELFFTIYIFHLSEKRKTKSIFGK